MTRRSETQRFRVIETSEGGMWPPGVQSVELDGGLYRRMDLPFILDPNGCFDYGLNEYWSDSHGALLKTSSLLLYARHIAAFLDFIWHKRSPGLHHRTWRDVTEDDRAAYYHWRNVDPDGPRIAASTWNGEAIAVGRFFAFQASVGNIPSSPIRQVSKLRHHGRRDGHTSGSQNGELRRPKKASAPWFTPGEYRTWSDVGLRGYLPTGMRDPAYRGEQSARNATFADLMFGVGLRLTEQATLLTSDIPTPSSSGVYSRLDVSAAVAKNESARYVLVPSRSVRAIETYKTSDRVEAIERAQTSNAYELLPDKIFVDGGDTYTNGLGHRIEVEQARPSERARLFRQTSNGIEPLALWLTAAGLPMKPRTWQRIFRDANTRVSKFGLDLECNVHKLRHSWATVTLAQLQRRYNQYRGGVPGGTALGDPLNWVSRRLGHRWIETTMVYIHNLNELETETILALIPNALDLIASPDTDEVLLDGRGLRIE